MGLVGMVTEIFFGASASAEIVGRGTLDFASICGRNEAEWDFGKMIG